MVQTRPNSSGASTPWHGAGRPRPSCARGSWRKIRNFPAPVAISLGPAGEISSSPKPQHPNHPIRMEGLMANIDNIMEHMEVLSSDGKHVGTVDHLEGEEKIKLTRSDVEAHAGHHHFIPV